MIQLITTLKPQSHCNFQTWNENSASTTVLMLSFSFCCIRRTHHTFFYKIIFYILLHSILSSTFNHQSYILPYPSPTVPVSLLRIVVEWPSQSLRPTLRTVRVPSLRWSSSYSRAPVPCKFRYSLVSFEFHRSYLRLVFWIKVLLIPK